MPPATRRRPAPHRDPAQDRTARIARLPAPYQEAARLLGEAWPFVELAWLVGELARQGHDDPYAVVTLFPEMKQRHDALFTTPLRQPRRGRPQRITSALLTVPLYATDVRALYEENRQAIAAIRAKSSRRGELPPSEQALAQTAKGLGMGIGKLRRAIFTRAVTRRRQEDGRSPR